MNREIPSWLRGWKLFVFSYLVLLLLSHSWRFFSDNQGIPLEEGYSKTQVHAVVNDSVLKNHPVEIAYRDIYKGTEETPPVLVLVHESPVTEELLTDFAHHLSSDVRVIIPDLPGFDHSKQEIPDYSMRSYAHYLNQLLAAKGIQKAHIAGYSFGGGVAVKFAHFHPEKVKSLILVSSLGVQELELLGGYTLNHAIHGIQLAIIKLLHEGVPHFGLLEDFPFDEAYARSFYDSDQRPIRSYLKSYRKPMLIQHGKNDGLVPLVAAREHHRLVPQSELTLYEGDHFVLEGNTKKMAADVIQFVERVENENALTYEEAAPDRVRNSKRPFNNLDFTRFEGFALFLIMLIIVLSTFITEDLTCIGAGLMAARGLIGFWPATVACFMGILIGDMGLYLIGRWMGKKALKRAPFKWLITERDLERTSKWFEARGPAIIIASRFLPGSRFPTYFSAGIIGAGFWMFSFYFLLAAVLWTPLLVGISMLVGTELLNYFSLYRHYALPVFFSAVLLLVLIVKVIIPAFSYRGRRILVSRWCRLTRWEFWPPYLLYFPVCCYIVWLWLKFGKLTLFTAANPGIEDGGFIGESKKLILDKFSNSGIVARYYFLPGAQNYEWRLEKALEFMNRHELDYPVVIKPDAGQRGEGVFICHDRQQLESALKNRDYDQLIQEYVEGEEYGVFYYRYPLKPSGHIYSITGKKLITLRGDGTSTLEELILNDSRAVCLAKMHLKNNKDRLYEVPAENEIIRLVELGTHARGAEFFDAFSLASPKLRKSLDEIADTADGFYFGRFDIRVPGPEDLKYGRNLKIIEVNGVTSESTNIYDSSYSYWDAQRILSKQWYIAYEIGRINHERGIEYSPAKSLVKKLLKYRKKY